MARSTIGRFQKPVLIIGQGARDLDWTVFGIPIITTRLAIDTIASDHPLFAGRFGLLTDIPSYLTIQNADYIISVGARLDVGFTGWNQSKFAPKAYKMIVDIDKEELKKTKANEKYNMSALEFYNNNFRSWMQRMSLWEDWLNQIHTWQKEYPLKMVGAYKVCREISDQADKNDIILVDTSSAFHIVAQTWQIKKGQRYITTGGISTMGYWPAAIGAALASGRRVICITGDGCLQMNIQELATVAKNNLNIKIFVLNNDGYLLIRHTQKKYFNRVMGESPKTGLSFPYLLLIAKAYGIRWEKDIEDTLSGKDPVLCELKVPKWQQLQGRLDDLLNSPNLTKQIL